MDSAKVGSLWTPPSRQGKTLGSLLRVVGCCHLSGLGCGTMTAAGLYRAQMMRAILLARATVTSIFGLRANICASHEPLGAPRRLAC